MYNSFKFELLLLLRQRLLLLLLLLLFTGYRLCRRPPYFLFHRIASFILFLVPLNCVVPCCCGVVAFRRFVLFLGFCLFVFLCFRISVFLFFCVSVFLLCVCVFSGGSIVLCRSCCAQCFVIMLNRSRQWWICVVLFALRYFMSRVFFAFFCFSSCFVFLLFVLFCFVSVCFALFVLFCFA